MQCHAKRCFVLQSNCLYKYLEPSCLIYDIFGLIGRHLQIFDNIHNSSWTFPNFKWQFTKFIRKILILYEIFPIWNRKSKFQMKFKQFQTIFCQFHRESLNFKCNFAYFNGKIQISNKMLPIVSMKTQFRMNNTKFIRKLFNYLMKIVYFVIWEVP